MAQAIDRADVQGLVRSGYADLTEAVFLPLHVTDAAAARRFLAALPVTSAADLDTHRDSAVHVALGAAGLRALGVPDAVIDTFPQDFLGGMAADANRSVRLGDTGDSAPAHWRWGGAGAEPHALLLLYAKPGGLAALRATIAGADFTAGFAVIAELATTDMGGREPFGFADGVSQPRLDWGGARVPGGRDDLGYGDLITAGEFLLGYTNEYGLVTDRPLPDAALDPHGMLAAADDAPGRRDLGRNGSFLVFRELHQDVRGFWHSMVEHGGGAAGAIGLAEAMVGRTRDGRALADAAGPIRGVGPDPADIARNAFTFDADPDGLRCPLGAHIRRANPRNGDLPGGVQGVIPQLLRAFGLLHGGPREDRIASSRFHRILRRGREYGAYVPPEALMAADAPAPPESGLHFICLAANITRQFEFIQNAWLMGPTFDMLDAERDPLIGSRDAMPGDRAADGFSRQTAEGPCRRAGKLPRFVTVRGGGYFFLPGLRALRYLAGGWA